MWMIPRSTSQANYLVDFTASSAFSQMNRRKVNLFGCYCCWHLRVSALGPGNRGHSNHHSLSRCLLTDEHSIITNWEGSRGCLLRMYCWHLTHRVGY